MSVEKKFAPTFKIYSPEDLGKEWFVSYNQDGKRKKVKGGINRFHTFDERMAAALELKAKLESEWTRPISVAEKMVAWVEERQSRWRKKSYQTFLSKVDVFLDWANGKVVTKELVLSFFGHLERTKHNTTYNTYRAVFRRILKGIGHGDWLEGTEKLSATSTPAKYFQNHQIQRIKERLLEVDPELWLACQFIYFTFIRPGELRLLKIGDIHFDEWKICVRSEISKNKQQQYVTVPRAFRQELEPLKRRSPREYIFFKKDCTKPLSANNLLERLRLILTELGFGHEYKLYSWKHTGAVAAVRAGASIKELQLQLRHHSLDEVDKYLRQLGVWDLNRLENIFPAPGEEIVKVEPDVAAVIGKIIKLNPDRPIVEVLETLLRAA